MFSSIENKYSEFKSHLKKKSLLQVRVEHQCHCTRHKVNEVTEHMSDVTCLSVICNQIKLQA